MLSAKTYNLWAYADAGQRRNNISTSRLPAACPILDLPLPIADLLCHGSQHRRAENFRPDLSQQDNDASGHQTFDQGDRNMEREKSLGQKDKRFARPAPAPPTTTGRQDDGRRPGEQTRSQRPRG